MCGFQQWWRPERTSLRAEQGWLGRVDTPISNQLSGGKAHLCLDGEFGRGSLTLPGPQFYADVGYEPSGSLLQLCESVYKDSLEARQSGS